MTTVSTSPPAACTAASAASAATTTGKPGAKSGSTPSAGDAFAALLQALAGGTDAGPALPAVAEADPAIAAEDAEPAPADPAVPQPPVTALPMVIPFVPIAAAPARGTAHEAPAAAAEDKPAAVAGPVGAARGKDAGALPQQPLGVADAAPAPRHAAAPEVTAAVAPPRAAAGEGESRTSARAADVVLPHGLHTLGAQPAAAPAGDAPTVPVHQSALPSHPLDRAFAGDIAAEVKLMADNGLQRAELHLNPADLGPLHIELTVSAQTADISFSAAHATTREGIEQALPALRDLLAGQGLQLGQAGVGSGGTGQQAFAWQEAREQGRSREARSGAAAGKPGLGAAPTTLVVRRNQGMLDLYA